MLKISSMLKRIFWKIPISNNVKEKLRIKYIERKIANENDSEEFECIQNAVVLQDYAKYVLSHPLRKNPNFIEYQKYSGGKKKAILIAYYLTQYSPDEHNDRWWGKGTTEWNNVSKAVPQFVGHVQPKLPGELGYYDLRIKDVMKRQIEIAQNYGVSVFSFYYYWFADERILEKPLNMFLQDKNLKMPFMFCWANENWTKRFSGTNEGILIGMDNTVSNYKLFIHEVMPYFSDPRYFKVGGKFALQIYRPNLIPDVVDIIEYWREEVRKEYGKELYLIACQEANCNWIHKGFDAENEWMQGAIKRQCKEITSQVMPMRKDFSGEVFDYSDMVTRKQYFIADNRKRKVYPAIMPAWDNTARRNNRGVVWHNSTPQKYKEWLENLIKEVTERVSNKELDEPIIFVNAWNEWGEGAYLEPDNDFGYAYLQATRDAIIEEEG